MAVAPACAASRFTDRLPGLDLELPGGDPVKPVVEALLLDELLRAHPVEPGKEEVSPIWSLFSSAYWMADWRARSPQADSAEAGEGGARSRPPPRRRAARRRLQPRSADRAGPQRVAHSLSPGHAIRRLGGRGRGTSHIRKRRRDETLLGLRKRKTPVVVPASRTRGPQRARAASSTASACPGTFTLFQSCARVPLRSINTVLRSTPMYLRPYMLFSTHTP